MPLTKAKKIARVHELTEALNGTPAVVVTDFTGLTTAQLTRLRRSLKTLSARYLVAKKTLLKRAFKALELDDSFLAAHQSQVGLAVGRGEETELAKIVAGFRKEAEQLHVLGGFMGGQWLDRARVLALARLPSRTVLLGRVVGTIGAPVTSLVRVLGGSVTGLVRALGAVARIRNQES
ncbi:50S ribosomal protein L10 [Candidatus Parcubacteria bacterium]|nr:50S ribosomal protein L10 [Candidatus Parcubacteria bacterium]MBI4385733.1 50S ribosomal protein L10 [Candidatus Parcubacteria bacterium]